MCAIEGYACCQVGTSMPNFPSVPSTWVGQAIVDHGRGPCKCDCHAEASRGFRALPGPTGSMPALDLPEPTRASVSFGCASEYGGGCLGAGCPVHGSAVTRRLDVQGGCGCKLGAYSRDCKAHGYLA